jgi:hypothetical protein
MSQVKICSHCKYFSERQIPFNGVMLNMPEICSHPNLGVDLINGKPNTVVCAFSRSSVYEMCGPNGDWFVLRETSGEK